MITNGNCEQQLPGGNTLLLYGTTHAVKHDAVTNNEKKRNMNTKFVTYVVLEFVSSNVIAQSRSSERKREVSLTNPALDTDALRRTTA